MWCRPPTASRVTTARAEYQFDAVILATGFAVDLAQRPELAHFSDKIALWADRVSAEEAALHPAEARHPYLGPGFELTERVPGSVPGLSHLHCFNAGSTMSHAAVAGDIPGLAFGASRLSRAIASSLFVASADVLRIGPARPRRPRTRADPLFPAACSLPRSSRGEG